MWILLFKLFKVGFKEAKKHKAKKATAANNTPDQTRSFNNIQQPPYPNPTFHPDGHNPPYHMPTASYPDSSSPAPAPAHLPPQTPPCTPQSKSDKIKYYLDSILRTLQLALCLAIIGLYGSTLNQARADAAPPPSKWVYAVVAGFLGGATALVYLVVGAVRPQALKRVGLRLPLFAWESVLCVLFLVLFGVFGGMFIGVYADDKGKGEKGYAEGVDVTKMRRAVWVDLVTLGLWVGTAAWAGLRWWRGNREGEVGGLGKEEDLEMKG